MTVSKRPVDHVAPAVEAVGRVEPSGADSATLFRYRLIDRQREIHAEIVCQKHREEFSKPGGPMAPLSDREKARGYEQRFTPFVTDGDHDCEACTEERERQASTYEKTMGKVG